MVSIGKPEVAKELVGHLGLPDGQDLLFVDPENALYTELDLNKGIKETFFSPSTPFAFLDRLQKKDGLRELTEVLSKWNKGEDNEGTSRHQSYDGYCWCSCTNPLTHVVFLCSHPFVAFYIPPKQDQAFNQGGTFVFDGAKTVFAHYDESTGAHADLDKVIRLATEAVVSK